MKVKYFGEIDPKDIEDYYDFKIEINGKSIDIDLNFQENSIEPERLNKVNSLLEKIEPKLSEAITLISQDFDLGDESETARDYLSHHLEVLEEKDILSLFGTKNVTRELFISKLVAKRLGLYPEDEEAFAIVDVTFEGDVSNYLMAVTFDENFELSYISMES